MLDRISPIFEHREVKAARNSEGFTTKTKSWKGLKFYMELQNREAILDGIKLAGSFFFPSLASVSSLIANIKHVSFPFHVSF